MHASRNSVFVLDVSHIKKALRTLFIFAFAFVPGYTLIGCALLYDSTRILRGGLDQPAAPLPSPSNFQAEAGNSAVAASISAVSALFAWFLYPSSASSSLDTSVTTLKYTNPPLLPPPDHVALTPPPAPTAPLTVVDVEAS